MIVMEPGTEYWVKVAPVCYEGAVVSQTQQGHNSQ